MLSNKVAYTADDKIHIQIGNYEDHHKFTRNTVPIKNLTRKQAANLLLTSSIDYKSI